MECLLQSWEYLQDMTAGRLVVSEVYNEMYMQVSTRNYLSISWDITIKSIGCILTIYVTIRMLLTSLKRFNLSDLGPSV